MDKLRHTLEALIDCEVFAFVPMLRKDGLTPITIRNVETGGVWIENRNLGVGVRRSPDEPYQRLEDLTATVCFIPWQQIGYIIAGDAPEIRKHQLLHFSPKNSAPHS